MIKDDRWIIGMLAAFLGITTSAFSTFSALIREVGASASLTRYVVVVVLGFGSLLVLSIFVARRALKQRQYGSQIKRKLSVAYRRALEQSPLNPGRG